MKELGVLQDIETSKLLYDLHIEPPILKQEEERQNKVLDCNYSKVDINKMVNELDFWNKLKPKLKTTLLKSKILFSGGLDKVDMEPIDIELEKGATFYYAKKYYIVPKMLTEP